MPDGLRVVVCDDERARAAEWAEAARRGAGGVIDEPSLLEKTQFREAMDLLRARQKAARSGYPPPSEASEMDDISILIIDYDLLDFDESGIETAESVAYLARCYSSCGFIVTLNQFGSNTFDLSMIPRFESFSDLNIGSAQLANVGLWRTAFKGFRPWHWPLIPQAARRLAGRTDSLRPHLDQPILAALGFTSTATAALHRTVAELLGNGDIENVTFRDFVLASGRGLRLRDKLADDVAVARIASARIAQWLEQAVVSGQDTLVDAPHLIRRLPSLARGDPAEIDTLNGAALVEVGANDLAIDAARIESHRLQAGEWLSRPVWFWPDVSLDETIPEVASPWTAPSVPVEFCEDVSQFVPADACVQFATALESPFRRRYVVNRESEWARQLLADVAVNSAADFRSVSYQPALRMAL